MKNEGLTSPKEQGRKKCQLKRQSEDDCVDNLKNPCENNSGNLLKCILANDEQQTVILHNNVIREVQCVRFIRNQSNEIVNLALMKTGIGQSLASQDPRSNSLYFDLNI